jgi:hypothetical protein
LKYDVNNYSINHVTLEYASVNDGEPLNMQEKYIEEFVIKPHVLLPGESSDGLVVCDTRDMNGKVEGDFQVVVSVDDEEHEFIFNRDLNK